MNLELYGGGLPLSLIHIYQLREAAEANNAPLVVALMRELVPTFVTPEEKNGTAGTLPSASVD